MRQRDHGRGRHVRRGGEEKMETEGLTKEEEGDQEEKEDLNRVCLSVSFYLSIGLSVSLPMTVLFFLFSINFPFPHHIFLFTSNYNFSRLPFSHYLPHLMLISSFHASVFLLSRLLFLFSLSLTFLAFPHSLQFIPPPRPPSSILLRPFPPP